MEGAPTERRVASRNEGLKSSAHILLGSRNQAIVYPLNLQGKLLASEARLAGELPPTRLLLQCSEMTAAAAAAPAARAAPHRTPQDAG
ncbi:hypothetical protein Emed_000737 [Eimeria media]